MSEGKKRDEPLPFKPCECGKSAILWETGEVQMTYPPRYCRVYWCACGRTSNAPPRIPPTEDELRMEAWRAVNQPGYSVTTDGKTITIGPERKDHP